MDRSVQQPDLQRLRVVIRGAVQGVGFRPFVYRLATEMQLPGWVINNSQGVFIEVEGAKPRLDEFLLRVSREAPPRAFIQSLESSFLDPAGFTAFEIRHSEESGAKTVLVLPDLAACPDCLRDIRDPANRRYRYPFTNCTNCGPRFSIIEALPYDRPNTAMKIFPLCDECRAEYVNPLDRRFHAQPNACPKCGPHLELWDRAGAVLATHGDALLAAAEAIRRGQIVAVKGIGGFHLMADARNEEAVRTLRQRKHREEKPFALMYPSLELVKEHCEVSALEERLLLSPESPIVLLKKRGEEKRADEAGIFSSPHSSLLTPSVVLAPNPNLGVMLPYTPLHHVLMGELGFPVVATSGNLSDEPICIDEREALERLAGIADVYLVHNRPIVRHVDDSIVRVVLGRELALRRARGFAPLPVKVQNTEHRIQSTDGQPAVGRTTDDGVQSSIGNRQSAILAVGAHLKNAVAVTVGENAFVSQHIGDLETAQAFEAFRRVIADLTRLYELKPEVVACDLHPDYLSTQYARELVAGSGGAMRLVAVQHHYAHVMACMAENELQGRALGVSWDGTGYGLDGTIWGGEFLQVGRPGSDGAPFERFAHLRTFRLPGGDRAVKEPRRIAAGLLYEMFGDAAFERDDLAPIAALSRAERQVLRQMLHQGLNAPLTSSAGRLFDAVAALAGLRQKVNYEGQAAMELEFEAGRSGGRSDISLQAPSGLTSPRLELRQPPDLSIRREHTEDEKPADAPLPADQTYPFAIDDPPLSAGTSSAIGNRQSAIVNWEPMVRAIVDDVQRAVPVGVIAAKFHNTLAEMIVSVAQQAGERRVVLSGGCFQNRYLLERAVGRLREAGFQPYWHQRVPPNDGGIALGQAMAALCQLSPLNNDDSR
jgi:hydrogenase maturation protein HypF